VNKLLQPQKGQGIVEYTLIGGLVLLVLAIAIGALMNTPAAQQMAAAAEEGVSNLAADFSVAAPARDLGRSHAAKHGQEAITAQQCFDKYGVTQQWKRPADGYKANICYLGMQFFIQIVDEQGGEVTKFERKGAKSLGDVGNYLKSTGYRR
jgi:hypothetical protein